jgi:hypothetical protein
VVAVSFYVAAECVAGFALFRKDEGSFAIEQTDADDGEREEENEYGEGKYISASELVSG